MNSLNLSEQIEHLKSNALSDVSKAKEYFNKGNNKRGLLLCHFAVEKALKAHFIKDKKTSAPRTHNLFDLENQTNLAFDPKFGFFSAQLLKYQTDKRYSGGLICKPAQSKTADYFKHIQELVDWLIQKL